MMCSGQRYTERHGQRDEKHGAHANRRAMTNSEREVRMREKKKKKRAGVHNRWKDCGMDEEEG